ncbi:hypothetical protein Tco_1137642, partial [Tanacetum coccineum]
MDSTIDFSNSIKHRLKKDKITKADLEGPVFQLLKGTYRSSIELEYHLEQRYLPFSDKLDWANPEGNSERKYTTLITKTKTVRSKINSKSRHDVFSTMKILSVIRVKVDKQFGYHYLEEIVVRRANKEYTFKEGDFPSLHLNDIEDMLILHVQNKLFNLPGDDIVNL